MLSRSLEEDFVSLDKSKMRETPTEAGKLGLRLLEDLTALAAGGSVCANFCFYCFSKSIYKFYFWEVFRFASSFNFMCLKMCENHWYVVLLQAIWLRVGSIQRTFALDILE